MTNATTTQTVRTYFSRVTGRVEACQPLDDGKIVEIMETCWSLISEIETVQGNMFDGPAKRERLRLLRGTLEHEQYLMTVYYPSSEAA